MIEPPLRSPSAATLITYEQRLKESPRWALMEGSMHFEKGNQVFKTLERIVRRLEENNIPFCLVGGLALFLHGYRRLTDDVDLLVTGDDLKTIHERPAGLGYVPPFTGNKQLRDVESGVKVEFLVASEFPGEGKPNTTAQA